MIKRRRLGPVYELSPAEEVRDWLAANIGKVMFTMLAWVIWIGVYYMVIYVVKILIAQSVTEDNSSSINQMMHMEISKIIILVGMVLIAMYILRDPMKRKRRKTS